MNNNSQRGPEYRTKATDQNNPIYTCETLIEMNTEHSIKNILKRRKKFASVQVE